MHTNLILYSYLFSIKRKHKQNIRELSADSYLNQSTVHDNYWRSESLKGNQIFCRYASFRHISAPENPFRRVKMFSIRKIQENPYFLYIHIKLHARRSGHTMCSIYSASTIFVAKSYKFVLRNIWQSWKIFWSGPVLFLSTNVVKSF